MRLPSVTTIASTRSEGQLYIIAACRVQQCRNSCGKWTCALFFCVSEVACLCCLMLRLLLLLTLTVILRLNSLDGAGMIKPSFINSAETVVDAGEDGCSIWNLILSIKHLTARRD